MKFLHFLPHAKMFFSKISFQNKFLKISPSTHSQKILSHSSSDGKDTCQIHILFHRVFCSTQSIFNVACIIKMSLLIRLILLLAMGTKINSSTHIFIFKHRKWYKISEGMNIFCECDEKGMYLWRNYDETMQRQRENLQYFAEFSILLAAVAAVE